MPFLLCGDQTRLHYQERGAGAPLVFVHEFGHYFAARLCRVHVEVFSIGFGRAIATWTDRVGTVWKLAWLPLGGYVKLHGQERPQDVTAEERAASRVLPWVAVTRMPARS